METLIPLFLSTFSTLLAVINPLEAMPVFLQLLQGQDQEAHHRVAFKSCLYATILMFFFLICGTLIMRLFGVPLSMIRIVGGIILMRLGFELFAPLPKTALSPQVPAARTRKISPLFPWPCPSWWGQASLPPYWA